MLISSMSKISVPRVEPSPFARRVGLKIVVNSLCRSKNCTWKKQVKLVLCCYVQPAVPSYILQLQIWNGYFLNPITPHVSQGKIPTTELFLNKLRMQQSVMITSWPDWRYFSWSPATWYNIETIGITLGGIGSCDVFWYPCDGGMITRRRPPTLMDFTAASIPGITCKIHIFYYGLSISP